MSDGDELPDFTPDYADAFFGVDTGTASGGGGRTVEAPVAATAPRRRRHLSALPSTPPRLSAA